MLASSAMARQFYCSFGASGFHKHNFNSGFLAPGSETEANGSRKANGIGFKLSIGDWQDEGERISGLKSKQFNFYGSRLW